MKKYLKSLVIMSCLVASAHNSDAASFSRRMGAGSKVAAATLVPIVTYAAWKQKTFLVDMQTSAKPVVSTSPFFGVSGIWTQHIPLSATPAVVSTASAGTVTPKDCGCNACPNTLANKPLSDSDSQKVLQALREFYSNSFPRSSCESGTGPVTPQQFYKCAHELSKNQIVPLVGLADHHAEFDSVLKRTLCERDYNALVDAEIYHPLSPAELNALKVITED